MDHFKIDQKLLNSVMVDLRARGCLLSFEEVTRVVDLISEEVIYRYVDQLITQVETILEINPHLTEREILEIVAKNVVEYLGAEAASIRIYDPGGKRCSLLDLIPLKKRIVRRRSPLKIPSPAK